VRTALIALFAAILVGMLGVTTWASLRVPIWKAGPDVWDPWSIATLCDAYAGFVTFFVWVAYRERKLSAKIAWFVLIMALGNIAMSAYVLRQLARLKNGESFGVLLASRNA